MFTWFVLLIGALGVMMAFSIIWMFVLMDKDLSKRAMLVMWLFIFVFLVLGLIGILFPRLSLYLSNWWRFQGDAEPSQAAIILYRIGGIISLAVSFILIYKQFA